jgi:hypothetical protein
MFTLQKREKINASPDAIYGILIDLESYADWNPWNFAARGKAQVGGPLVEVDVTLGTRKMTVQHKILVMSPGRVFQWADTGWFTTMCYGQRTRYLEPHADGGTDYLVTLQLTGPLVSLVRLMFGRHLVSGLAAETAALKARAEANSD